MYGCESHQKCGHPVRVTSFKSLDVADKIAFAVEEKGEHSGIMSNRKRIDIHPMIKAEIDSMLAAGGSGPSGSFDSSGIKVQTRKHARIQRENIQSS